MAKGFVGEVREGGVTNSSIPRPTVEVTSSGWDDTDAILFLAFLFGAGVGIVVTALMFYL